MIDEFAGVQSLIVVCNNMFICKIIRLSYLYVGCTSFAMISLFRSYRSPSISSTHLRYGFIKFSSSNSRLLATIVEPNEDGFSKAINHIRNGGLVSFPTETVYGLGADSLNEEAVKSIFRAKGRPANDPVIIHVSSKLAFPDLYDYSFDDCQSPREAIEVCKTIINALADDFWPGPLTIIFRANKSIPDLVTAYSGFVGLRCPSHPFAKRLISSSNRYIAAPSANRFGHVSPTSADHVMDDLGGEDIIILRDNPELTGGCGIGVESTVCRVNFSENRKVHGPKFNYTVSILRSGAITANQIRSTLLKNDINCEVTISIHGKDDKQGKESDDQELNVAPGQMIKHYAPDLPTYILNIGVDKKYATSRLDILGQCIIIDFNQRLSHFMNYSASYYDLSNKGDFQEACATLYSTLRLAESLASRRKGIKYIILPAIVTSESNDPTVDSLVFHYDGLKQALWERLFRAASGQIITKIEELRCDEELNQRK